MIEVFRNLFVGAQEDEAAVHGVSGWYVIHACKEPYHRQNGYTDAADLHAFHGKCETKASWTRGLFISQSGFSEQGLIAFGKGKRLICIDGLDLSDTLRRGLHLPNVLSAKVRRAGEHGTPFVRVRDLFPE